MAARGEAGVTVVTEPAERIRLPHGVEFYDHQAECVQAFHEGARRMIWRHHRQSGKGGGVPLDVENRERRPSGS
jgi:hypothetical protein